jgi:uracil-DNA glycosylase family 4
MAVMSGSAVTPGSGWPGDRATRQTPIAHTAADVAKLAATARTIDVLAARVSVCRACPRLVEWREQVAQVKRRAFAAEPYWGRPIAGFGAPDARILIVGLAPAAHGGNRTGRMFTGDRSGDWLFAALHRAGLANQATSIRAADGLRLHAAYITAAVRCAPPANLPTTEERQACRPWLERDLEFLWPRVRAVVVLGGYAWAALWPALRAIGVPVPARLPAFGHGVEAAVADRSVIGCYHVSQQNTFTGRLTEAMLDAVLSRAVHVAGLDAGG